MDDNYGPIMFRMALGQLQEQVGWRERRLIRRALRSPGVVERVAYQFQDRIDNELPPGTEAAFGDGAILKWIIEHQDEIMKFITMIISLFGGLGAQARSDT